MELKPLHSPTEPSVLRPIRIAPKKPLPPANMTWRCSWLLAAPHRLAFFSGAVMMATIALWWTTILLARSTNSMQVVWMMNPSTAHALLMSLGFMPLFFVGFLFTAGPKWLNVPELPTRALLPLVVLTLLGWVVCLIGFHTF